MAPNKEKVNLHKSWPWWRWVFVGLSTLALGLSSYLGWHYLVGGSVVGCNVGSSCEQVLNSRWSAIGGVLPVSGLAAEVYLAMLVSIFFIGPATEISVRRLAWSAMLVIVGAAAGSAVWFTILQKWLIGAFCPYCTTTHVTGLLLAVLVIWQAPRQKISPTTPRRIIGILPTIGLVIAGLSLAAILAVGQFVITVPAVHIDGESQENFSAIEPNTVPFVGSPDAQHVVNLLFDYKCPHCQKMHFMLNEAIRRYDGTLAFALCPAPLDKQCNPYIPQAVDYYKDSCEMVRIGLAVWLADREVFPDFENWMFSFESGDRWKPRSLEATKAKAIELVGQAKFDAAKADPWIDRYLQTSIQLYGRTIQGGKGGVPKLVYDSRWIIPEPYSADDLVSILRDSLGVPMPLPND